MRTSNFASPALLASILLFACGILSAASGQTAPGSPSGATPQQQQPQTTRPTVVLPQEQTARPIAGQTELYCAGFIQSEPVVLDIEVVGGLREESNRIYSAGDYLLINSGAQQGMRVGQLFSVVRPRGPFDSKLTKKKDGLGIFMQELGQLRITEVKERVSVAEVTNACETILLGDLLRPVPQRVSPLARTQVALDQFSDPNGKQQGRIVMARDHQILLARNQIVYIDLGREDSIKTGDYFTVYRPLGTGNLTRIKNNEIARNSSRGFESDRYRGGWYGNQAQRPKNPNELGIFNPPITTREIKNSRPPMPRQVVGEIVVLSVQGRTATAIITQVAQEIHTGDFVELQ